MLSILSQHACRCTVTHQDLRRCGIEHDFDSVLFHDFVELGNQIAANRATILRGVQVFVGSATGCSNLGQRRTDRLKPFYRFCAVFRHGGDKCEIVEHMSAVHGILNEFLDTAIRNSLSLLEFRSGTVHAAGCLEAVSADHRHLFKHKNLGTLLCGPERRSQASAAGTDNHHIVIKRHRSLFCRSFRRLLHLKDLRIQSALRECLTNCGHNRCTGYSSTGDAIDQQAVGFHNGFRKLFHRHRANTHRLILFKDFN